MKKLFFILAVCLSVFASAQCPVVNLPQNAKWKFNFSQCFLDTTTHTYVTPAQVAYFDGNQNLTTIPFAQLADSIGVSGPNGNQWNIQYYDGGNFGSSTNFNFNGFNGVFYIYDVNGDTLFSVNVNTREVKSWGVVSFKDYADSGIYFGGSNGKVEQDSVNFVWDNDNNALRIGTPNPTFISGSLVSTKLLTSSTTQAQATFLSYLATNSATGASNYPLLQFTKTRGTVAAPTALSATDQNRNFGGVSFGSYDGTNFINNSAQIRVGSPRNWAVGQTPSYFEFWTTPSNSTTAVRSVFFTHTGGIAIGDDWTDTTYTLTVNGTAAITQTPASTNGTDDIAVMDGSTGQVKTMPFEEGTYLPTDSGQTNFNTLTLNTANYSRVGKTVTVFGTFNMDPLTAGGTLTFFYLSLPIATNLPLNSSGGTFNGRSGERGTIYSDGNSSNRVLVSFLATTTSSTIASYSYSYTIQ